jgi:hypothetical protein
MSAAVYPGFDRAGALGVLAALGALVRKPAFGVLVLVLVLAFPTQPPFGSCPRSTARRPKRGTSRGAQQYNFITGG